MGKVCTCGHNQDDHGHDPAFPGSTACQLCDEGDCIAFEEAEEQTDD